jgi:hypothetical protein
MGSIASQDIVAVLPDTKPNNNLQPAENSSTTAER